MKWAILLMYAAGGLVLWLLMLLLGYIDPESLGAAPLVALPLFVAGAFGAAVSAEPRRFGLMAYFLASVFLFFCINIALWPIASQSPYEFFSLVHLVIDTTLLSHVASLLGVSVSLTLLAYTLSIGRGPTQPPIAAPGPEPILHRDMRRLGLGMMIVALPFVCYRLYVEYTYVLDAGYAAIYTEGGVGAGAGNPLLTLFNYLFYTGFGLICAFGRQRRTFRLAMGMFLVAALLDGIKGGRGTVIVPFLFCWWFYSSYFQLRIKPRALLLSGLLVLAVFLGLTVARDADNSVESSVAQFAIDALAAQGRSLQTTAVYLMEQDEVRKYGKFMVSSNLMLPINVFIHPELRADPQSLEQVLYSNNLKHVLTYTLSPDYYFAGGGTGGVYLIELIEAGFIIFVALSLGLGWFLARVPDWMRMTWFRFVSLQIFAVVFYMPRGELFPNMLIFGKSCLIFLALVALVRLVSLAQVNTRPGIR